jgi:hypothetical protein
MVEVLAAMRKVIVIHRILMGTADRSVSIRIELIKLRKS